MCFAVSSVLINMFANAPEPQDDDDDDSPFACVEWLVLSIKPIFLLLLS